MCIRDIENRRKERRKDRGRESERQKQEKANKASASCHYFHISRKMSGDERKKRGKENYFLNRKGRKEEEEKGRENENG